MDNWLQSALRESNVDLASTIGVNEDDARTLAEHPGRLTLNDINALCRAMPADVSRRMLDAMVGTFAL